MLHFIKHKSVFSKGKQFKIRLLKGIIEIIKYTYSEFCGLIFTSLVCATIGRNWVWIYDGTNICYGNYQVSMIVFGIVYAIPFPVTLVLAMRLLKRGKASALTFTLSCLCPLVALVFLLIRSRMSRIHDGSDSELSEESKAIISVMQGPYRDDDKNITLNWEAMISVRRLVINAITLIRSGSIRMAIMTVLCVIFLYQHKNVSPFDVRTSNHVEGLSLSLLIFTSVNNLLKASLTDNGIIPSGPSVIFFKGLELCKKLFVLLIIGYVLWIELDEKSKRCKLCTNRNSGSYMINKSSKQEDIESTHL